MSRNGLAYLTSPQPGALPLKLNTCVTTIRLHLVRIAGLEDILPRQVQCCAVVAHIHHLLFDEALSNLRRNALEDDAAIGDWCFTARLGRLVTIEPQFHRPVI